MKRNLDLECCEATQFEQQCADNHSSQILQSPLWAQFKELYRWKAHYLQGAYRQEGEEFHFSILLLRRQILRGLLTIGYVPFGPVFHQQSTTPAEAKQQDASTDKQLIASHNAPFQQASSYLAFISQCAQSLLGQIPLNCFLVKFDLPFISDIRPAQEGSRESPNPSAAPRNTNTSIALPSKMLGLLRSRNRIQVPDTLILPLKNANGSTLSQDDLLAAMHKKHRYNIRLAVKKGVIVEERPWKIDAELQEGSLSPAGGLATWYKLYQETAERDQISIHHYDYYQDLFILAEQQNFPIKLWLAYDSAEPERCLAGIIVAYYGACATYLYGASSNYKRELMPNYLLQWRAICDAQNWGCQYYDFFGIPSNPDPKDPLHGLYRFKTGFGGYLVSRMGLYDYPYSRLLYTLFHLAESTRSLWHHKFKKLLFKR